MNGLSAYEQLIDYFDDRERGAEYQYQMDRNEFTKFWKRKTNFIFKRRFKDPQEREIAITDLITDLYKWIIQFVKLSFD